jgi:predicted transcriptional regulator
MRSEPRGYWTRVFDQAATLLRARPELNGDTAYWMARRMVDQALAQASVDSETLRFFPETLSAPEPEPTLVLAP